MTWDALRQNIYQEEDLTTVYLMHDSIMPKFENATSSEIEEIGTVLQLSEQRSHQCQNDEKRKLPVCSTYFCENNVGLTLEQVYRLDSRHTT